ncbi:hypothetical protein M569_11955, partial [Genlisea aurea]
QSVANLQKLLQNLELKYKQKEADHTLMIAEVRKIQIELEKTQKERNEAKTDSDIMRKQINKLQEDNKQAIAKASKDNEDIRNQLDNMTKMWGDQCAQNNQMEDKMADRDKIMDEFKLQLQLANDKVAKLIEDSKRAGQEASKHIIEKQLIETKLQQKEKETQDILTAMKLQQDEIDEL